MFKVMDRNPYEKLSIRESAKSLKKYGSTSKHVTRTEHYLKHYISNTDTLQGIALKYDVTIEQIRRVNRLWASDSLFLKEFLLIPAQEAFSGQKDNTEQSQLTSPVSPPSINDEDNVEEFLGKIDAAIANTKKEVKKTQNNSEFAVSGADEQRGRVPSSRLKKTINNNSNETFTPQSVVVVQQGRRIKSSLKQHEQEQEELFKL